MNSLMGPYLFTLIVLLGRCVCKITQKVSFHETFSTGNETRKFKNSLFFGGKSVVDSTGNKVKRLSSSN